MASLDLSSNFAPFGKQLIMKQLRNKGFIALAGFAGIGLYAFGNQEVAPVTVSRAFYQKVTAINKVKWEKES